MFRIELLPAEFGDCLWIEYGDTLHPHRILIDCGTKKVYKTLKARILALKTQDRHFDLFVVSHIDVDHIGGAVDFLKDYTSLGVKFDEIWFNGYVHLADSSDILGPIQGEQLTCLIHDLKIPWNRKFHGKAVVVPEGGRLPAVDLAGGMKLTLLSPFPGQLRKLEPEWKEVCTNAGLVPGTELPQQPDEEGEEEDILGDPDIEILAQTKFNSDETLPNGSSIAFLVEFEGKNALFAADAHVPVLLKALDILEGNSEARVKVDVVKLSHHGSKNNTSSDLIKRLACKQYLVSTNGKQFKHPNLESIARIIHFGGPGIVLNFNYRTRFNDMWENSRLRGQHKYDVRYPESPEAGIAIEL